MNARNRIISQIEDFLRRSGMSERQFGIAVNGDHKLVKRLREGAGITLTVIEKAERFMGAYGRAPEMDGCAAAPERRAS